MQGDRIDDVALLGVLLQDRAGDRRSDDAVAQPPLGLRQVGLRLTDLRQGAFLSLDPRPFLDQLQGERQSLHAPVHRLELAHRGVVLFFRDHVLGKQLGRPLVVRLELLPLDLRLGQLGPGLGYFLRAEAAFQFVEVFLGRFQEELRPIAVGLVIGVFQLGDHVPLGDAHALDNRAA